MSSTPSKPYPTSNMAPRLVHDRQSPSVAHSISLFSFQHTPKDLQQLLLVWTKLIKLYIKWGAYRKSNWLLLWKWSEHKREKVWKRLASVIKNWKSVLAMIIDSQKVSSTLSDSLLGFIGISWFIYAKHTLVRPRRSTARLSASLFCKCAATFSRRRLWGPPKSVVLLQESRFWPWFWLLSCIIIPSHHSSISCFR